MPINQQHTQVFELLIMLKKYIVVQMYIHYGKLLSLESPRWGPRRNIKSPMKTWDAIAPLTLVNPLKGNRLYF